MIFKLIREQLISINRLSLISGISRNQIYNIESCRSVPRLDTAFLLWFILDYISPQPLDFFYLWSGYNLFTDPDQRSYYTDKIHELYYD